MSHVVAPAAEPSLAPEPAANERKVSPAYRRYALGVLVLIYTVNFLDRQIVTNLIEPIKHDLKLSDTEVGAMAGLWFAILYTVLGIPIARMADKGDRPLIITVSLFVWSGFTLLASMAQNFITLAISRMGVGVGEAGCTPTAHSLITEYFPKEKRARAISIYSMGISIGSLLGMALGALIADKYGWRPAFLVAGAPGLILAVVSFLTLVEPRRKNKDAAARAAARSTYIPIGQALKVLANKPTFWLLSLGGAFASSVSYAHSFYLTAFFLRNHFNDIVPVAAQFGLKPLGFIGVASGLAAGIGGVTGSFLGGWWCDRFGVRDARHFALLPIIYPFIGMPIFWYLCSIDNMMLAMILLAPVNIGVSIWYGPVYAGVPSLVPPAMRATTSAIMLFIINMIGLGGGPTLFGMLSDALANGQLAGSGLDVTACKVLTAGQPHYDVCAAAAARGLHDAVYISTSVNLLAILCFIGVVFTIRRDMES